MTTEDDDSFYVGYLPKAPAELTRFTRRAVVIAFIGAFGVAGVLAAVLPYFGNGRFEFGQPKEFTGTVRCEFAPRLSANGKDYLLVGEGKNGVPLEFCGAANRDVTLQGTLIEREGRQLIEVSSLPKSLGDHPQELSGPSLGRFTLTGEIVDSKCYFGVMNPAEGRAHRACAVLCLRGGVPAVFVARDRTGAVAHLLITGPDGRAMNEALLRWVGEGVEASGEVVRKGKWLVLRLDPSSLRLTTGG